MWLSVAPCNGVLHARVDRPPPQESKASLKICVSVVQSAPGHILFPKHVLSIDAGSARLMSVALASDLAHREALLTRVIALIEDEAIDDISMASRSRYIPSGCQPVDSRISHNRQQTGRNGPTIPNRRSRAAR